MNRSLRWHVVLCSIVTVGAGCDTPPDVDLDSDASELPVDAALAVDAGVDARPAGCPSQTHDCGGTCVANGPNDPARGCTFGCGAACPTVEHGAATCSTDGTCDVVCDAGYAAVGGQCSPSVCEAMNYVCGTFVDDDGAAFECGACDGSSIIFPCRPDHTCAIPLESQEPNDTAPTATNWGEFTDGGFSQRTHHGRAHAQTDEDWYRFHVEDATNLQLEPLVQLELWPHTDGWGQYEFAVWARCDAGDDALDVGCGSVFSSGTWVNDPVLGAGCIHEGTYMFGYTRAGPPGAARSFGMLDFLLIFFLIVGNGVFAGAEIALLSVRKTRLSEFIRRGDPRALAVQALRDHPERFLATLQIGLTVVGTAAATFGGAHGADAIAGVLRDLGLGDSAPTVALVLVIAAISFAELIIGELVPKSLALRFSDRFSFIVARPVLFLSHVMRPLVWLLTGVSNLVLRLFGDKTNFTEARLSRDELQELVEEAAKTGSVDPRASEIASRALEFEAVSVGEVMVPRNRVAALRQGAPADEIQRTILEEGHSRMPVYEGQIDNIVGYVVARDVLALAWEQGLVQFADILRPPYVVGERTRALDLLREMQRRRVQMAVVTDEHGGLAGLVTIEDLIEELVGDIFSEDDEPDKLIEREASGTAIAEGWAPVRKVNRALDLDLPVGADRTTIAGLCMSLAQAIPQAGERLTTEDGTILEVIEASPRRVRRVRIHPVGLPVPPPTPPAAPVDDAA
jgi:putative hemolysin